MGGFILGLETEKTLPVCLFVAKSTKRERD